jgi:hypothetical protein
MKRGGVTADVVETRNIPSRAAALAGDHQPHEARRRMTKQALPEVDR